MKKKSNIYFLFDNFAYFCIRFENGRHFHQSPMSVAKSLA